jgi:hypothetical protein
MKTEKLTLSGKAVVVVVEIVYSDSVSTESGRLGRLEENDVQLKGTNSGYVSL